MSASPLPVQQAIATPCASSIISLPFTSHVLLDDDEVGAGVVLLDVVSAGVVVLLEDVGAIVVVLVAAVDVFKEVVDTGVVLLEVHGFCEIVQLASNPSPLSG